MFQVRIHGRGGQGVVTAAEILSVAAFDEGRHAQAFPSFGSERTGAPVVSFCRIDDRDIRSHEPVMEPDAVILQDVTLIHQVDLFSGISTDCYVLINTSCDFSELGFGDFFDEYHPERLMTCPATDIALEHVGRPLPTLHCSAGSRRSPARSRWTLLTRRCATSSQATSASATRPRSKPPSTT